MFEVVGGGVGGGVGGVAVGGGVVGGVGRRLLRQVGHERSCSSHDLRQLLCEKGKQLQ